MWMVPGGGESIKFLARSAGEAERQAIEFIRRHCIGKGYLMRDQLERSRSVLVPFAPDAGKLLRVTARRYRRSLPVRFGRSRPILLGQTDNISETGLFLTTEHPLPRGDSVGMTLDLDFCKVDLRASVVWQRPEPVPGLPQGMGLELVNPPSLYVSFLRALA
jgi:hypothetical protein